MDVASHVTSEELKVGDVVLLNKKQIMIVLSLAGEGRILFVSSKTTTSGSLHYQHYLFTDEELIGRL